MYQIQTLKCIDSDTLIPILQERYFNSEYFDYQYITVRWHAFGKVSTEKRPTLQYFSMIKNYLIIALRNFLKNRAYTTD